jgi:hypothetical protein
MPLSVDPIQTKLWLPFGTSQQPKQSQPFGVSGAHAARHLSLWDEASSSHLVMEPGFISFGSYSQRESPLGG